MSDSESVIDDRYLIDRSEDIEEIIESKHYVTIYVCRLEPYMYYVGWCKSYNLRGKYVNLKANYPHIFFAEEYTFETKSYDEFESEISCGLGEYIYVITCRLEEDYPLATIKLSVAHNYYYRKQFMEEMESRLSADDFNTLVEDLGSVEVMYMNSEDIFRESLNRRIKISKVKRMIKL